MSLAALRAQLAAALALVDSLETSSTPATVGPRYYHAKALPPGFGTWRATRETAARLGVVTSRPGRHLLIDAASFDAAVAQPRSRRSAPAVADSDEIALAKMGVQLRVVR